MAMTPDLVKALAPVVLLSGCSAVSPNSTISSALVGPGELCQTGVYRANSAEFLALTRSGDDFSYMFSDGTPGTIGTEDARVACEGDVVSVDETEAWAKVVAKETNTRFRSGDALLAGRLMEPPNAGPNTPLVVFAHGSESVGWIDRAGDPYQMLGRGVSVFVYDKRGTGRSEGRYSQNFPQLADDLVAASREARRLAKGRFGRFGLVGLSQGGWIAPLASNRAGAEFIGIGYGIVADIREEDAAQVQKELRDAGYGPDVLTIASEITKITALVASSDYKEGLEELSRFQQLYSNEPWYALIKGGYTGVFLNSDVEELRKNGVQQFNDLNIDWSLDPVAIMRAVDAPQLWVLAGEDREAPIELSLDRLGALKDEGKDIALYVFPDTDHGMWEYEELEDGTRSYQRVTLGFYDLLADWANDAVEGQYGTSYKIEN